MKTIYYAVMDTEAGGLMESALGRRRGKTVKLDEPMIGLGQVVQATLVHETQEAAIDAYRSCLIARADELEAEAARLRARAAQDVLRPDPVCDEIAQKAQS